ncbi:MAG TPA: bifunctional proline dehydrogenase/L-glutamate gamma-semialdehyde dehydrogenase [Tessaracoccus flavescens]|uniref:L-glutamate gamma-semialdehyde dehydrogenase n=1 Tax=Tessaracoccus flavescens TaxID=399497 RepID=A0A921JPE8_9ACTN|nr:bifunctional proline dehydrogenase/L-glutamate gamma-semialdehyde dehydrogenase [Tessaracoccus flavescens]
MTSELPIAAAVEKARRWAEGCTAYAEPASARLLAGVLKHPEGLRFTLDFVDGVLRPEDRSVSASALGDLACRKAPFLPLPLRSGMKAAAVAPRVALPAARRAFSVLVGDLVVDVGRTLGPTLRRLQRHGASLNVNLLGEAVLGNEHAAQRLTRTMDLLNQSEVDYVSIKVSAVLGQHAPWGHAAAVDEAVERLRPLMRHAASLDKFVNLDMEEYRDLHLTLDVFKRLLMEPELLRLRAGIAVQTYLSESLLVLQELDRFAEERTSAGGAPIKVRLVKGANLAMERVQAQLRGWDNPVLGTKAETDASFLRALDFCLSPERAPRLLVGAASHNIYSLAAAVEMARERGVQQQLDFEMLSGMAVPLQKVLLKEGHRLRLYVPVVPRKEFDAAIAYLVRRLEENAAPENFMSGAASLGKDRDFLDREEDRFRTAAGFLPLPSPSDWAIQSRPDGTVGFVNAPDSNPALLENQHWAQGLRDLLPSPELGADGVEAATITDEDVLDDAIARGRDAGRRWAATPAGDRAEALLRLGSVLEEERGRLIVAAMDEVGKLFDQADVEVSEACDFARYYAERSTDSIPGATPVAPELTVVAPPWNFPIAIPLGGVAAAVAAGSAVILKPAPPARRIAALLAQACHAAGIPDDVVQLVVVDDGPLGQRLITGGDLVILTGAAETAELFRSWRPDLPLLAETSGKNAIVVTPSADLDLAAADLVASAFGHAGQKCSAASLGILVGTVATSKRFRDQVVDAASSLRVEWPADPLAEMGPLTEPAGEKLLRGLTQLGKGESWLVKPRRISDRLWTPGIRTGVRPGSEFHQVEYFGPVLGLMSAPSLEEAIAWQNATAFGLTAGLHSLDPEEIQTWLDRVEAGNVYVNRTITGAIVRRQPFGGWKRSAVGPSTKAGGPNYLLSLRSWEPTAPPGDGELTLPALAQLLRLAERALPSSAVTELRGWMLSDEAAARSEFRAAHDPSALSAETNVLRYRPCDVTVRVEEATPLEVLREVSAAVAVGAVPSFSFRDLPGAGVISTLRGTGMAITSQTDAEFDAAATGRIRHLGERDLLAAVGQSIDATVYPGPSLPGRLACLPYVREQAVSITRHRFGHPVAWEISL